MVALGTGAWIWFVYDSQRPDIDRGRLRRALSGLSASQEEKWAFVVVRQDESRYVVIKPISSSFYVGVSIEALTETELQRARTYSSEHANMSPVYWDNRGLTGLLISPHGDNDPIESTIDATLDFFVQVYRTPPGTKLEIAEHY
jgi:hypothetical protein